MYKKSFKNFTGGIADNHYYMGEGQVIDSRNVDLSSIAPAIETTTRPALLFNVGKEMFCKADDFFFGEDGKIVHSNGTVVKTTGIERDLETAIRFNDMYIARYMEGGPTLKMLKIDVAETNNISRGTPTSYVEDREPTNWTLHRDSSISENMPVVEFGGELYIGNGTQVLTLDKDDVIWKRLDGLNSHVVGFSVYGTRLKVFLDNGEKLFRDGVSESYSESVNLKKDIKNVYQAQSQDYIISGSHSRSEFGVSAGYEYQQIKDYHGEFTFLGEGNTGVAMAELDGKIYLPGTNLNTGICTYGEEVKGMGESFNLVYTSSSYDSPYSRIYAIRRHEEDILVSYEDDAGNIGVDILAQYGSAHSDGYITLRAFDGGNPTQKKTIKSIEIHGYGASSSPLTLSYFKDKLHEGKYSRQALLQGQYTNFVDLVTLDESSDKPSYRKFQTDLSIDFYDICFRVDLEGSAKLLQIDVFYEDIDE